MVSPFFRISLLLLGLDKVHLYLQIVNNTTNSQTNNWFWVRFLWHEWILFRYFLERRTIKTAKRSFKKTNNNIRTTNWAKWRFCIVCLRHHHRSTWKWEEKISFAIFCSFFFGKRKQNSKTITIFPRHLVHSFRIVCAEFMWLGQQQSTYVPFTITFLRRLLNNHTRVGSVVIYNNFFVFFLKIFFLLVNDFCHMKEVQRIRKQQKLNGALNKNRACVREWANMKKGMGIDSRKINVIVVQIAFFSLAIHYKMNEWINKK